MPSQHVAEGCAAGSFVYRLSFDVFYGNFQLSLSCLLYLTLGNQRPPGRHNTDICKWRVQHPLIPVWLWFARLTDLLRFC